jgi:hypothetical protein
MKTTIITLLFSMFAVSGTSQVEISTLQISDFYFFNSILCIQEQDLPMENSPLENETSETVDWYSKTIPWITIVGFIVFVFFSCKHAFLSLQCIEYEKFYDDMTKHFVEQGYIPTAHGLDMINSYKYFFSLKVWKLADLLDPFTQEDFRKWSEDNTWRPNIAHYKYL